MSLKLSPGCECCPSDLICAPCSDGTLQDEFDVTLSGLSNESCDGPGYCEDLNGTFTLSDRIQVTAGNFGDGWSGNLEGFDGFAREADVPSGATDACVWRSIWFKYCEFNKTVLDPSCYSRAQLTIWGLCLAKFRISDTEYIWRMIVNYEMQFRCDCGTSDIVTQSGGWYWQLDQTTDNCSLSGSESWTAHFPDMELIVSCTGLIDYVTFDDFCSGELSMTNIENG